MKRSGFNPKFAPNPATQCIYTPRPRAQAVAVCDGRARMVVPVPKSAPVRDEAYRRLVANLPCAHCGRIGPSQCAHSDLGKGMGIKSSDTTCFPLCPPCHTLIGASGTFTRDERRQLEQRYAQRTREKLGKA